MNLYKITHSNDPKETGRAFNQLELDTSLKAYNVNWPNAYWQIPGEGKIPFDLAISDFSLADDAFQTDHLRSSITGGRTSIVSDIYLDIIKESKIGEHDIFPIRVVNNYTDIKYFIFRLWYSQHEALIDWDNTIWVSYFQRQRAGDFDWLDEFHVANLEALRLKRKEEREKARIGIKIKKLCFKSDIAFDDLFHMGVINQLICTESFRNKIDGVVTGIDIEEFYDTEVGFKEFNYSFT